MSAITMSLHKGITCDVCLKENFAGIRYKCLACRNYDLCATCYNEQRQSMQHSHDHPVQTILTQPDFEIFFGYEANRSDRLYQSFTCSYCGAMGFSNIQLRDHVLAEHSNSSIPVICPLCAVLDGGSVSLVEGLSTHMALHHPELHESGSGSSRSGRHRAHYAPRHGVWMTMPSTSRRDFVGIPSEILSSRHRDDLLSHLTSMRGSYGPEELLSLELQFPDGIHRTTGLPYQHLIGSDDLRLFYDQSLMTIASNDPSNSATNSTSTLSAERTKSEQPSASPMFLLEELEQNRDEEETETWEVENVDRSTFVQELFLSIVFEPTLDCNIDNIRGVTKQPIGRNTPNSDSSNVTVPSLVNNHFMQRSSIEMNPVSVMPSSLPVVTLLDDRTIQEQHVSSPSSPNTSEKVSSCDNLL